MLKSRRAARARSLVAVASALSPLCPSRERSERESRARNMCVRRESRNMMGRRGGGTKAARMHYKERRWSRCDFDYYALASAAAVEACAPKELGACAWCVCAGNMGSAAAGLTNRAHERYFLILPRGFCPFFFGEMSSALLLRIMDRFYIGTW